MPEAPEYQKPIPSGEYGNLYGTRADFTFAGEASGTKVYLCRIPAGSVIRRPDLVNEALGAGVTLDLGFENEDSSQTDDPDYFLAAVDGATASRKDSDAFDLVVDKDTDITLTTGGAAATGKVEVDLSFLFKGVK